MIRNLLLTTFLSVATLVGYSQCTDWANPPGGGVWTDFGSAPCNGEFTEFDVFEIYASEAYQLLDVIEGGNYTFSACDGPNVGSWEIDFTIISPSGTVDAYGTDDDSPCSITWTASESGTYVMVINEVGNCGVENSVLNGYPRLTTNFGAEDCPVFIEGSESFEDSATDLPECWQSIDQDNDGRTWEVIPYGAAIAFHGTNVVASYSYENGFGALTPDNYLITPKLNIGTGDSLYYYVRGLDGNFPQENYSVLVSTTGSEIEDFTDVLFTEMLTSGEWIPRTIDFSDYEGQSIYIAFRHHDVTDQFAMLLDAILLPGTVDCVPIAVEEVTETVESKSYPNPATTEIHIVSELQGAAVITIFDATGRQVMKTNTHLSNQVLTQNIEGLESGAYIIQIQTGNKVATQRFIKQ